MPPDADPTLEGPPPATEATEQEPCTPPLPEPPAGEKKHLRGQGTGMDEDKWDAQTQKLIDRAKKKKRTPAELKAFRAKQLEKAMAAKKLKEDRKSLALAKAARGDPLTPQDREDMLWSSGQSRQQKQNEIIDAAASLVIKPTTITELRLVVEQTAARFAYNPIAKLIELASSGALEPKEEVAVHKALLPFLAPQLPQQKHEPEEKDTKKVRVTVMQFQFNDGPATVRPLHEIKPKTVEIEATTVSPETK